MARILKDPLLDIARALLILLMVLIILVGVGIAVGLIVVVAKNGQIVAQTGAVEVLWALIAALLAAGGIFAMGFLFLRHMKRIVDSVGEGDPFIPVNASRLTAMAWLMLAMQLIAIPVAATANWIVEQFDEGHTAGDYDVGGDGLILILTLFILARVFRKGTEMREDLEGTV